MYRVICICAHSCMYLQIYMHMHMHMRLQMYAHLHVQIYMHMQMQMHKSMCACVEHLKRCKTSTLAFFRNLAAWYFEFHEISMFLQERETRSSDFLSFMLLHVSFQAGGGQKAHRAVPHEALYLGMVSLGYPGWSPGRTCIRISTVSMSIFCNGDRPSPEPACRSVFQFLSFLIFSVSQSEFPMAIEDVRAASERFTSSSKDIERFPRTISHLGSSNLSCQV